MIKPNKTQVAAASAIALCIAVAGIGAAYAASDAAKTNPMGDMVNAIAQKFGLNAADVQKVFDEQKTKMDAQRAENRVKTEARRQQEFTDRINKAVTDGKLTQAQADKITAKKSEVEAQKTSLESKTPQERGEAMKAQMDSLKQWAADNGIPEGYLPCGGGMGRGMGRGHGFGGEPAGATGSQSSN